MRSGFESSHYELFDPESLVSVIATELHEPSNKSKSGVLALLRPGCNVTHPRALASSGCKKKFKTRFGHSLLLAFQRAIANLFIDKKTAKFYEPPKSGIAVLLRPGCDVIPPRAVATSGCKELSWWQIWVLLIISFRTRYRSSLYDKYSSGCYKTLFTWGPPLPMSPSNKKSHQKVTFSTNIVLFWLIFGEYTAI